MLSLTIHHSIHLTKEERYALHDGVEIATVGVSVPVWFSSKTTSEPAREVFCRYYLNNPKKDVPIQILENGYEIALPYREGTLLSLSDEEWREMNKNNHDKLDALYKMQVQPVSSKNLLDVADGGCGGLCYREHNKMKHNDQSLVIMHYVCIESMEHLLESIDADWV